MNYTSEDFKFTVSVSREFYETKEAAKLSLSKSTASKVGKEKMSFTEKTITVREMMDYATSGYAFTARYNVNPDVKYCLTDKTGKKTYSYPTYKNGKNKGGMKLSFKRDEFFKESSVVFVDIDLTKYPTIPDYLNTLEYKPTFTYPSYSDNISKNGITSRRFRMVYVFTQPLQADEFKKVSGSINAKTEIDTAEELEDRCNEVLSQYMNGCYDCTEKYYTGIIYDYSDFIDTATDRPKYGKQHDNNNDTTTTTTTDQPEKEIVYDKAMFYDMSHLDYDSFMTRYRWQFNYSYDNSNPNGWIRFGESEVYYQFVGEDYFKLFWNVDRVRDGQKRRKKVFMRMCLRRILNPEISLDSLMFCAYEDIHRFFDNSDNALGADYILRNATNCYKMELTEIESRYSDTIKELKDRFNPSSGIILKSGSATGGLANTAIRDIKFSKIDEVYDTSLSVAENKANIEKVLFPISERSLYYYCKERGINTKESKVNKNEQILEAYNPEISLRKNWDYINKNICKVSLGKLSKLIKGLQENEHPDETLNIYENDLQKNEHLDFVEPDNAESLVIEDSVLPEFAPVSFELPQFSNFWGGDNTGFDHISGELPLSGAESSTNPEYNSFGFSFLPDSIDNSSISSIDSTIDYTDNNTQNTTTTYYTSFQKNEHLEGQQETQKIQHDFWGLGDIKFNLDPSNVIIKE